MITSEQFLQLLPLAVAWAERQENYILENGVPLTTAQLNDAKLIPIVYAEKVRLMKVGDIPLPDEPSLRAASQDVGLITQDTAGLTLRYGIFIRADCWENRKLIVHELTHVSQYEKLGGTSKFLKKYLQECISIGYPQAPMEQEAISTADKICR